MVEAAIAGLPVFRGARHARVAALAAQARLALRLARALAGQVLALIEMEANLAHHGARRLASYLDSLAGGAVGACRVQLPASKTVIASLLGMKKETLSRLLRLFADRGLIEVTQRNITILNRAGLARFAG